MRNKVTLCTHLHERDDAVVPVRAHYLPRLDDDVAAVHPDHLARPGPRCETAEHSCTAPNIQYHLRE